MILQLALFEILNDGQLGYLLDKFGGMTVTQGEPWSTGYIVGAANDSVNDITDNRIEAFAAFRERLARGHNAGMWVDDGKIYIDSVERIGSKRYARQLRRERGELSIYDIEAKKAIM